MSTLAKFQTAINGRAWVTVDKILNSLPTSLPTSLSQQAIETYLNTTRAIIDHLNQCVDPTISLSDVNPIVYGLVLHESASLPEYLAKLLDKGGDLTFIIDRLAALLTHLCFSLEASDVRSKLGDAGTVEALSRYYCQNPRAVPVIDALNVLACGHIENADFEITCGVVTAALSVLSSTELSNSTSVLVERILRLLGTVAICAPNDPSPDKKRLVPIVLEVLQEANRLSLPTVAEHALTVLANASDCLMRERYGYDFVHTNHIAEETVKAWTKFKTSPNISHRAAWSLVSLIHIDDDAREYVINNSDKIMSLFDDDLLTYDTHSFLKESLDQQRAALRSQKSKQGRFRKPWSQNEDKETPGLAPADPQISDPLRSPFRSSHSAQQAPIEELGVETPPRFTRARRRTSTLSRPAEPHNDASGPYSAHLRSGFSNTPVEVANVTAIDASDGIPVSYGSSSNTLSEAKSVGLRRSERHRSTTDSHTSWRGVCDSVEKDQSRNINVRAHSTPRLKTTPDVCNSISPVRTRSASKGEKSKKSYGVSTRNSLINKQRRTKNTVVLLPDIQKNADILEDASASEYDEEGHSNDDLGWDSDSDVVEENLDAEMSPQFTSNDDTRDTMCVWASDDESMDGSVIADKRNVRRKTGSSPNAALLSHMNDPINFPLRLSEGARRQSGSHSPVHRHSSRGSKQAAMSRLRNASRGEQNGSEDWDVLSSSLRAQKTSTRRTPTASPRFPRSCKLSARAKCSKRASKGQGSDVIVIDDSS